jgi:hypothetical protein
LARLSCAVAILLTVLLLPAAARADYDLIPVPFGAAPDVADGLPYDAIIERVAGNVSPRKNVAVFEYRLPDGRVGRLAVQSERYPKGGELPGSPKGHAEIRALKILRRWGIEPEWVRQIYTDLEPCNLPGSYCARQLRTTYPKLDRVYFAYEYGDTAESRRAGIRALESSAVDLRARYQQATPIMRPPGGGGGGTLPRLLAWPPSAPGGIDFSSLELRYVAAGAPGPKGLRYAFKGARSPTTADPNTGMTTARQSSDAFFTWLALPPQTFWVNLNPNEPNRIIDPKLARTDAGHVLLDSDLLLKKTTVGLIRPDTPLGDQFWDELEAIYGARADQSCISFRVWIVPEPATVRETANELYILDAPLTVRMESEFIPDPAANNPGCPLEDAATEARKEELFRRLILPKVIEAVNTAPQYEPLRRVYLSRVAAEWFRRRSYGQQTPVSKVVDSGNIDRWAAPPGWNPFDTYNQYLYSIRHGEWTVQRGQRTLIYGGVDFSRTPRHVVGKREFQRHWPKLAKRVKRAQARPVARGGDLWLGGASARTARRLTKPTAIPRRRARHAHQQRPAADPCAASAATAYAAC